MALPHGRAILAQVTETNAAGMGYCRTGSAIIRKLQDEDVDELGGIAGGIAMWSLEPQV